MSTISSMVPMVIRVLLSGPRDRWATWSGDRRMHAGTIGARHARLQVELSKACAYRGTTACKVSRRARGVRAVAQIMFHAVAGRKNLRTECAYWVVALRVGARAGALKPGRANSALAGAKARRPAATGSWWWSNESTGA